MATKTKTTASELNIMDFLNAFVDNDQKKHDSLHLIDLMKNWSGFEPKMWGPTIIGFGRYHYKYASGHEGDSILIGFSPRKAAFSLYVCEPEQDIQHLLDKLGKYKMGKACIYFKKLADLDLDTLEELCKATIQYKNENYDCASRQFNA